MLKGAANPPSAYLGVSVVWVMIAAGQVVLGGGGFTLPRNVWPAAVLSAAGLGTYYIGTLLALRSGQLSVYYPIIRSSPLAIVAIGWLLLGKTYAASAIGAILLIIVSALLLQRSPGRLSDDPRSTSLAVAAMLGSAVYSIADAQAMQHVTAGVFIFWVYVLVSAELALACLLIEDGPLRERLVSGWRALPMRILVAAVTSYASYQLILEAFRMGAGPAEVSAVRQASIPVSVVLAAIILREPKVLQRLAWGGLMAVGIAILVRS